MKKVNTLGCAVAAAIAAAGFSGSAFATDGYQLIGVGQYAVGMGGAVVAAPDDPLSAAISNPAGLALIKPQAAFSAEVFNPTRKTNFGFGSIGSHTNIYGIPSIGWVAPAFGDGIVFGGGVYGTSGLGVNYLQATGNPDIGNIQGYSSIFFMQMAPSLAMKVDSHLAVGASLNIAAEQASFQQTASGFPDLVQGMATQQMMQGGMPAAQAAAAAAQLVPAGTAGGIDLSNPSWAYGVGITLGALYKVNDMVTLGATYKSPMIFTPLTWQSTGQIGQGANGNPVIGGLGQYSAHLNYPQQIALGIAIRPIPQWLISVEGQWINWHNTLDNFTIYGPWNGQGSVALPTHWQNQWVANIGTQYDVNNWLQVRMGYAYGSNPIRKDNIGNNLLFPAVVENAITVGSTQKLGGGWKLTEAYMHSFANTMTGPSPYEPLVKAGLPLKLQPASATLAENSFGLQIGYDF